MEIVDISVPDSSHNDAITVTTNDMVTNLSTETVSFTNNGVVEITSNVISTDFSAQYYEYKFVINVANEWVHNDIKHIKANGHNLNTWDKFVSITALTTPDRAGSVNGMVNNASSETAWNASSVQSGAELFVIKTTERVAYFEINHKTPKYIPGWNIYERLDNNDWVLSVSENYNGGSGTSPTNVYKVYNIPVSTTGTIKLVTTVTSDTNTNTTTYQFVEHDDEITTTITQTGFSIDPNNIPRKVEPSTHPTIECSTISKTEENLVIEGNMYPHPEQINTESFVIASTNPAINLDNAKGITANATLSQAVLSNAFGT